MTEQGKEDFRSMMRSLATDGLQRDITWIRNRAVLFESYDKKVASFFTKAADVFEELQTYARSRIEPKP